MSEKKTTRARGKSGRADPGSGGFDPAVFRGQIRPYEHLGF